VLLSAERVRADVLGKSFCEIMSGTQSTETFNNSPNIPRSVVKRSKPLGLDLVKLMTGDASALAATHQHKRSFSAAGRTLAPAVINSGSQSAGLKPESSASAMSALELNLSALQSPCFVHKTFGKNINLERVLDECRASEQMTHQNLLHTATGVREIARQLSRISIIGCAN
jgi:hypothetical protein